MLAVALAVLGPASGCRREPERDFTDKEILLLTDEELARLTGAGAGTLKPADYEALQREKTRRLDEKVRDARSRLELLKEREQSKERRDLLRRIEAGEWQGTPPQSMPDAVLEVLTENADALDLDEVERTAVRAELARRKSGR